MFPTIIRAAACAAILVALIAASSIPVEHLLATSGTLSFTLPSREAGDSCGDAQAPLFDLDSVFLDRQDPTTFPKPVAIKRASARGMEGWTYSFTYACDTPPCQYLVWTKDTHGNRSCPSSIVQVGGSVGVPPESPALADTSARLYDVAGRRILHVSHSGVYFTRRAGERVGRVVVIR